MSVRKQIGFDIETIPAPEAKRIEILEAALTKADAEVYEIKPPGNITKPESMAEWMRSTAPIKAQAIRDEAKEGADAEWRKTSLNAAFGRIYCLGYSINGAPSKIPTLEDFGATLQDIIHGTEACIAAERQLIEAFAADASFVGTNEPMPQYIGHNIIDFDLRFIFQRAVIIGAKLPKAFPIVAKPWEQDRVFDTMAVWAGTKGRVKLDVLCEALGLATKGTELGGEHIDGSMVADYVYRGEGQKVAIYCGGDVDRSWGVFHRLNNALSAI